MENYNISENIKFCGFPVHFAVVNDDVAIHVKGFDIKFSMLKNFVENPLEEHFLFTMQNTLEDDVFIKIDLETRRIHLGCWSDTFENALAVYHECERLLELPLSPPEDFINKLIE